MTWDGKDRRMSDNNNDILQRMAVKQAEIANDVKHMVKWSESHDITDTNRFNKMEKDIVWQNKIIYGAFGIIAFLGFITKFIK